MAINDTLSLEEYKAELAKDSPEIAAAFDFEEYCGRFLKMTRLQLKFLRKASKISQKDIAERLGMTQSAVSRIENGQGDVGMATVYRYTMALCLRPIVNYAPSPSLSAAKEDIKAVLSAMEKLAEHQSAYEDRIGITDDGRIVIDGKQASRAEISDMVAVMSEQAGQTAANSIAHILSPKTITKAEATV